MPSSPSTRDESSVPRSAPPRSPPPRSWLEPPTAAPLGVGNSSETAAALLAAALPAGVLISAAADRATLRDKGCKVNSKRTWLRSLMGLRPGVRRRKRPAQQDACGSCVFGGTHARKQRIAIRICRSTTPPRYRSPPSWGGYTGTFQSCGAPRSTTIMASTEQGQGDPRIFMDIRIADRNGE